MPQVSTNLQLDLEQVPEDDAVLTGTYINKLSGYASTSNMNKIDAFAGNIQNTVTNMQGSGYTNQTLKGLDDSIKQTNQKVTYTTTVTGTDTLVGTIADLTSISNNLNMFIIPTATNTGVATLNINNTGALPIVKVQNWTGSTVYAPLEAGDLTPNIPVLIKKSPDGLRYFYIGIENSASHIYYKNGTNNYTNLQTKLATLDAGIPINTNLSFSPTTITKTGEEETPLNLTFTPRHIINGLGKIGGFYKDSNSDGLADGWTGSNAGTFSLSNGEQTFTPTATGGGISISNSNLSNRVVFACVSTKSTDNTLVIGMGNVSGTVRTTYDGSNTFKKNGALATVDNASTFTLYPSYTTKTSSFVPITVKQAFYCDVTDYPELVGLTNQQKLDWCLANLEYSDGIGVSKNQTIKVTGKNLFDGQVETGTIDNTGTNAVSTLRIRAKNYQPVYKNKQYTWSNNKGYEIITLTYDSNKTFISVLTGNTITAPSNCSFVRFRTGSDGQNDLSVLIQLEEGTTATTYEPYRESITTVACDGLTGDEISILNNQVVGNKLWSSKKVLYGKDYPFTFAQDFTGYKSCGLSYTYIQNALANSEIVSKPNADILTHITYGGSFTASNQSTLGSLGLYFTVPDSESGFAESLNPNDDEFRCVLNGWKVGVYASRYLGFYNPIDNTLPYATSLSTGTNASGQNKINVVNGSLFVNGRFILVKDTVGINFYTITNISGNELTVTPNLVSTINADSPIMLCDDGSSDLRVVTYCKNNVASYYDGYSLYYKFTNAKQINNGTDSYLAPIVGDAPILKNGVNTITYDTGIVIGEIAYPKTNQTNYHIGYNNTTSFGYSPLQNKQGIINNIYKNGVIDTSNWTFATNTDGTPFAYISNLNFDTSATYTIDYNILRGIALQIGSCVSTYSEGIVDSINGLYGVVEEKQNKNVVLDNLVEKSIFERINVNALNFVYVLESGVLYQSFIVPISEKIVKPTMSITNLQIRQTNGAIVTDKYQLFSADIKSNYVRITFKTTDSTLITNKTDGAYIYCDLTFDCRGRV